MKLDLTKIQDAEQEYRYILNIYVDQSSDYAILNKLINAGDIIETKIRRKDKSLKNPIFYAVVDILVDKAEFVNDPSETIHIIGNISLRNCIYTEIMIKLKKVQSKVFG